MKIYIPSLKRSGDILNGTIKWIPDVWLPDTVFIVHNSEAEDYRRALNWQINHGLTVHGLDVQGIDKVRFMIGILANNFSPDGKFLMLDDDLNFAVRERDDSPKLRVATEADVGEMLRTIDYLLDEYAHVSISMRQGNNNGPVGPSPATHECGRGIRAMAFRVMEFLSVEHGRVPVMEDFDVTLQLLRKGYKNAVLYHWAQDQKQTNARGGCSTYRSHEVQTASAERLVELHPGYAKLRVKENKGGGEFGKRTEVTVFWKEAWKSSQRTEEPTNHSASQAAD